MAPLTIPTGKNRRREKLPQEHEGDNDDQQGQASENQSLSGHHRRAGRSRFVFIFEGTNSFYFFPFLNSFPAPDVITPSVEWPGSSIIGDIEVNLPAIFGFPSFHMPSSLPFIIGKASFFDNPVPIFFRRGAPALL
jgi:hypothetical protein